MKTYETYKDSGIEWIGEIPTEWNVARLRYRGKSIIGITYKPDEVSDETNGTLVLRSSNVQNGKLDFKDCVYVDKKIQESQLTKEGDILVCARNGSAHLVGKCAYIPKEWENVSFGAFMSIVRTDLDKFLFYYFNSQVFKGQKGLFATSTINQLTSNMLNNLNIPIPPTKEEQTAIANYLDKKTAEIDQLIAEKEQLVALYQEEKTAIINQAVTKGINPDVKLKDSGIEWLEDIPEHWEVEKVKRFIQIKRGAGYQYIKEVFLDEPYEYVLRISDFNNYNPIRAHYIEGFDKYRVLKDDILIAGTGASAGITMYVDSSMDGMVHSYNALRIFVSNKKELNSKFLFYSLRSHSLTEQMNIAFTGSAQHFLDVQRISDFIITLPSESEQTQIVKHIKKESIRIDAKITKAKQYINLLTEYRTALISEVVTGKIKVID